jgi:hypothetical protein
MGKPYPYIARVFYCLYVIVILLVTGTGSIYAQTPARDTTQKNIRQFFQHKKQQATDDFKSRLQRVTHISDSLKFHNRDTLHIDYKNPFRHLLQTTPALRFAGGYTSYNFNYRSNIDTPYTEKDIVQHNIAGRLNFIVAGNLPIQVTYWMRQSNSQVFRNIFDVQVSFSGAEFRNRMQSALRDRMLAMAPSLRDSLTEKLYELKVLDLDALKSKLKFDFSQQKLIEANEVLKVPRVTFKPALPDSVNAKREDSLRKVAAFFLEEYAKVKQEYERVHRQADSLKKLYQQSLKKINQFRQMVSGVRNELGDTRKWKAKLSEYGLQHVEVPAKYRWLMGVRNFSVGRTPANYSELTAKNISVNGVNFEYNSWYYFAALAGTVNYRFRDFVVNGFNRKPQYLYMVRAGIGRLERNYFIVSAYRGQKQLFAGGADRSSTISVMGFSAETRLRVNQNTYVIAEAAKSLAPDFRNNPPQADTKFNLSDKTNQAWSFKIYSWWPRIQSRLEAFYKYTGANFQSFSGFQTNAAQESWYIKGEQQLFKRKLRIAASLRKNEFSNPFLVQDYKSNTVFKSITASFRLRKWPVITVGYQPMSQLTRLDNQLIENRFQTLIASLYYMYSINQVKMASTVMVNKFYNSNTDSGFIYYNATNVYWMQNFFYSAFTANVGMSFTKNPSYTLNVLDANIQPKIGKMGSVGVGVKINNLNNVITKVGGYVSANIRFLKQDVLFVSYEHGYLPGYGGRLVQNEMANIQFVKTFR